MQGKTVSAASCLSVQTRNTYHFNNVRSFIVILVVIIHAALGYAGASDAWWSVPDRQKSIIADISAGILDIFIMPVLFFVSGYFTRSSFEKGTRLSFVKKKADALMVPWLFGFIFINPFFPIMTKLHRKIPLDSIPAEVISYWRNIYTLPLNPLQTRSDSPFFFSHYHFWYLSLLFLFFVIYALFGAMFRRVTNRYGVSVKASPAVVSAVVLFSSFGYCVLRMHFSDSWFVISALQFQIARVVPHFCFFLFGIVSADSSLFTVRHRSDRFVSIALISLAIILSLAYLALSGGAGKNGFSPYLYCFLRYATCMVFLFGILIFAKAFDNGKNACNSFLNRHSFDVYTFHLSVVVVLQFLFDKTVIFGAAAKFISVSILSVVSSYLLATIFHKTKKILMDTMSGSGPQ